MSVEDELYYICLPRTPRPVGPGLEVVSVQEFLADEPACKALWEMVGTQFRTRGKFLTVWSSVRYVALHRDSSGAVDGVLLISAPINWQIDYVVVRPEARGRGVASALLAAALNRAFEQNVPYVMLTSRPSLRPLYEGCGFTVVNPGYLPRAATVANGEATFLAGV
ncbi:MAG TPA: GNAT family N-acetyltransferase [Gemmataceae bacterium]